MKLVEFSRGYEGMREGERGDPVFVAPGYVSKVWPCTGSTAMSFIGLVDGSATLVLGSVSDVAHRLAGQSLERLPNPEAKLHFGSPALAQAFVGALKKPGSVTWLS